MIEHWDESWNQVPDWMLEPNPELDLKFKLQLKDEENIMF